MTTTPLEPALFASLDPPRLAGSRCADCGTVTFPAATSCPRCTGQQVLAHVLPDRGTVWSWTVQRFCPKPPYLPPDGGFRPFAVGYVDLGEVLVEARLVAEPEQLSIGAPVRLVLEPAVGVDGAPAVGHAFAPVAEGA
ncbi:Zn-ribbon domain-containing OB-fold protein [Goekera deserti]|uniref:Zn-ribbon domain-containing OB-fold protein n=1 Tax=Goekera deserti TaxID=2497753 RepID=UPI001576CBBF|nr:OB-fold domain-containing protein [Goekera deserti]